MSVFISGKSASEKLIVDVATSLRELTKFSLSINFFFVKVPLVN